MPPLAWLLVSSLSSRPLAFDIEEWGAVEAVEANHIKFVFAHGEDVDHRGCDGVGPCRGAHGEDTHRLVTDPVAGGKLRHVTPGEMEPVKQ